MAKIRHIALTTDNPRQVAEFYKSALDMEEIRENENGAIFLSDGYINLAIRNWKTEKDADVGLNGPNYNGIHHIGFQVEDLDEACQKLESVNGTALNSMEGLESIPPNSPRNFEMKWSRPNDVVIDVSHTGWATS